MNRIGRRTFIKNAASATVLGGIVGAPAVLRAQDGYPNRTLRFIVPLAPGGAIDFIARVTT